MSICFLASVCVLSQGVPRTLSSTSGFPPGSDLRDNWHIGKAWFMAAESKSTRPVTRSRHGHGDFIFRCPDLPVYYADNLEKDGTFGQVAQRAWQNAENEWHAFGERPIDTSFDVALEANLQGRSDRVRPKPMKDATQRAGPGRRDEVEKEKRVKLTPEEPRILGPIPGSLGKVQGREGKNARAGNRRCSRAWMLTCRPVRKPGPTKLPAAARRSVTRKPQAWPSRSRTTSAGQVHEPRADGRSTSILANAGQGRADGRVPGSRKTIHNGDRPSHRRHDPGRPAYEDGLQAGGRCSMIRSFGLHRGRQSRRRPGQRDPPLSEVPRPGRPGLSRSVHPAGGHRQARQPAGIALPPVGRPKKDKPPAAKTGPEKKDRTDSFSRDRPARRCLDVASTACS